MLAVNTDRTVQSVPVRMAAHSGVQDGEAPSEDGSNGNDNNFNTLRRWTQAAPPAETKPDLARSRSARHEARLSADSRRQTGWRGTARRSAPAGAAGMPPVPARDSPASPPRRGRDAKWNGRGSASRPPSRR